MKISVYRKNATRRDCLQGHICTGTPMIQKLESGGEPYPTASCHSLPAPRCSPLKMGRCGSKQFHSPTRLPWKSNEIQGVSWEVLRKVRHLQLRSRGLGRREKEVPVQTQCPRLLGTHLGKPVDRLPWSPPQNLSGCDSFSHTVSSPALLVS